MICISRLVVSDQLSQTSCLRPMLLGGPWIIANYQLNSGNKSSMYRVQLWCSTGQALYRIARPNRTWSYDLDILNMTVLLPSATWIILLSNANICLNYHDTDFPQCAKLLHSWTSRDLRYVYLYEPSPLPAVATWYRAQIYRPSILTPAGIRQDHRVHSKPSHLKWTRKQLRGLTFIVTDRGPLRRWQWVIKRADVPFCQCGEIQNAVHLTRCPLIADGAGRSLEQVWKDKEWCGAVAEFLSWGVLIKLRSVGLVFCRYLLLIWSLFLLFLFLCT